MKKKTIKLKYKTKTKGQSYDTSRENPRWLNFQKLLKLLKIGLTPQPFPHSKWNYPSNTPLEFFFIRAWTSLQ